jgi:hypothetical protein
MELIARRAFASVQLRTFLETMRDFVSPGLLATVLNAPRVTLNFSLIYGSARRC